MVELFKNHRIVLLRGGPSSEREISLLSGEAILKSLRRLHLDVCDLIVPETKDRSYLKKWVLAELVEEKADICFIALHGEFGEDGILQGILEEGGYLYTGSDSQASEYAMNKITSKVIFKNKDIPTPKYKVLENDVDFNLDGLNYPLIVKPSAQGSSIGIFKVDIEKDLRHAVKEALFYDGKVIVEEFLKAAELTVGILENKSLPVIRINSSSGMYDYQAKYTRGISEYVIPADVEENIVRRARDLALKAHKALGCHSFSRVDMLYSRDENEVYVLEVNTIPGFTNISLLPRAAKAAGIEFDELALKMLKSALQSEKCLKK